MERKGKIEDRREKERQRGERGWEMSKKWKNRRKKKKVTERGRGFKKQGKKSWGGGTGKTDERMVERTWII